MSPHDRLPITVAILGGDPLVGRTLEVVLGGPGYEARFLNGAFVDNPVELPEEVRLVILGSGLHPKGRESFLSAVQGAPAAAKMPVLELVAASDRERAERPGAVRWPCRVNDLKQRIEAALPHAV